MSKLGNDLRALNLDNYHGNRTKFLVEWFEILRKMDKMGDRDDKYPYVHVRMQLMEAVKSDPKLTDAFTTLAHEEDKSKRIQLMKDHMMLKAAVFDGSDNTTETTKSTARSISALAHVTGVDESDLHEYLVNKGKFDPSTRIPSDVFNTWSRESKQEWFNIGDNLKKDIVKATMGNPKDT